MPDAIGSAVVAFINTHPFQNIVALQLLPTGHIFSGYGIMVSKGLAATAALTAAIGFDAGFDPNSFFSGSRIGVHHGPGMEYACTNRCQYFRFELGLSENFASKFNQFGMGSSANL